MTRTLSPYPCARCKGPMPAESPMLCWSCAARARWRIVWSLVRQSAGAQDPLWIRAGHIALVRRETSDRYPLRPLHGVPINQRIFKAAAPAPAAPRPPAPARCPIPWPVCPEPACKGMTLRMSGGESWCTCCGRRWRDAERMPCPDEATVTIRDRDGKTERVCRAHADCALVRCPGPFEEVRGAAAGGAS